VIGCLILLLYYRPIPPTETEKLFYPDLVKTFYQQNQNNIFWFAPGGTRELRQELINCIDTAMSYSLVSEAFHYKWLKQNLETAPLDSLTLLQTDHVFTDAAIAWMKNLYEGYKMSPWVTFDQATPKYEDSSNQWLLDRLNIVRSPLDLQYLMEVLPPRHIEYRLLRQELKNQKQKKDAAKIRQLTLSMNYVRWINHFHFERCIVVNIASAYLRYYERDSMLLFMKTVLGKPSTPTPRFAASCDQVILYPYWYVPRKIAVNEYLDRLKRNPGLIDALNMQVIDAKGKILNPYGVNWSSFNKNYFPYTLRQSTGCDNALGVIKFNVTSPYGVYLHDTNNKTAFLSGYRYYSHGCIRIEEPIKLGNRLLNNTLDTTFLLSCFKEQKPIPLKLDQPVPVFVVYMPVETSTSGKIRYYKDVYKLMH
jgi:murein L,D-transpeptidase YcbB/YkuD